jgi:hypothetical protein
MITLKNYSPVKRLPPQDENGCFSMFLASKYYSCEKNLSQGE